MSNQDEGLRNLFRDKIDGMEVTPPAKVLEGVEASVFPKKGPRIGAVWYLAALLALVAGLFYLYPGQADKTIEGKNINSEEAPEQNENIADTNRTNNEGNKMTKRPTADSVNYGDNIQKDNRLNVIPENARDGGKDKNHNANPGSMGADTADEGPKANSPKTNPKNTGRTIKSERQSNQKVNAEKESALAADLSLPQTSEEQSKQSTAALPPKGDAAKQNESSEKAGSTDAQENVLEIANKAPAQQSSDFQVINGRNDPSTYKNAPKENEADSLADRMAQEIELMKLRMALSVPVQPADVTSLNSIPELKMSLPDIPRHFCQVYASVGREIRNFEFTSEKNPNLVDKKAALRHSGIGVNYQYLMHKNWALHTGFYAYRTAFITRLFPISIANQNLDGELVFDTPDGEYKSNPLELSELAVAGQDTSVFLGRIVHRSRFLSIPLAIRYNTGNTTGMIFYTQAGMQFNIRASERNTLFIKNSSFERSVASSRLSPQRKIAPSAIFALGLQTQPKGRKQYFGEINYSRLLGKYYEGPRMSIRSQMVAVSLGVRIAL